MTHYLQKIYACEIELLIYNIQIHNKNINTQYATYDVLNLKTQLLPLAENCKQYFCLKVVQRLHFLDGLY